MLPGLNPKKMQAMMKQMGISQSEIEATKVEIHKSDGNKLVIEPAGVTKVMMQGQETYQVVGETREESAEPTISEEDIKTVAEKTNKSEAEAKAALEETGDLAEAILKLSE